MSVVKGRLAAGAVGGALGGIAIKALVHYWDPDSFGLSSRTDARAAQRLLGGNVDEKRAERVGAAIHYAFGIVTGTVYAAATRKTPGLRVGRAAVFGGGLWLIGDELAVSATGLEDPSEKSAAAHASALVAHLLYGVIVEACCSKLS